MKKILIVIIASLLLISCGKKDKPEENKTTATPDTTGVLNTVKDDAPPKDVAISYQLLKDKKYTYRLTSISNTTQSVISDSTMKQNLKQTISYIFELNVTDVDADKVMDIKINLSSVNLTADANGQKITYQSGTKMDSLQRLKFLEYEAVVNNPFAIRLDQKGEILEIYRVDKIVNKFLTLQGLKDSVTIEQKKQFQTNISETALKPLIQQIFRTLPKNKVGKDSTWTNQYTTRLGVFEIDNIAKYKLTDFAKLNDERLAVVDAGLDIVARGKNKVSENGVNYDFKKPEATGSGTIYFNLNKGCIEKSKTSTTLKMSLTMNMPKTPRGPMKATRNDFMLNTNVLELL
ncbi:MAG: DUF6263 family protein [Ignavibacteriales bacterium]|nr:DUF6263 family protein [Ignavibacteriales bacterium]